MKKRLTGWINLFRERKKKILNNLWIIKDFFG